MAIDYHTGGFGQIEAMVLRATDSQCHNVKESVNMKKQFFFTLKRRITEGG